MILISFKIAHRPNPVKKLYPSLAIENRVQDAVAVADDEMERERTIVKPLQTLAPSTGIATKKMTIPATSSARTAGFHRGKKRLELWLPSTWKTISETSPQIDRHAAAAQGEIGNSFCCGIVVELRSSVWTAEQWHLIATDAIRG
jgi:hypothetical protein